MQREREWAGLVAVGLGDAQARRGCINQITLGGCCQHRVHQQGIVRFRRRVEAAAGNHEHCRPPVQHHVQCHIRRLHFRQQRQTVVVVERVGFIRRRHHQPAFRQEAVGAQQGQDVRHILNRVGIIAAEQHCAAALHIRADDVHFRVGVVLDGRKDAQHVAGCECHVAELLERDVVVVVRQQGGKGGQGVFAQFAVPRRDVQRRHGVARDVGDGGGNLLLIRQAGDVVAARIGIDSERYKIRCGQHAVAVGFLAVDDEVLRGNVGGAAGKAGQQQGIQARRGLFPRYHIRCGAVTVEQLQQGLILLAALEQGVDFHRALQVAQNLLRRLALRCDGVEGEVAAPAVARFEVRRRQIDENQRGNHQRDNGGGYGAVAQARPNSELPVRGLFFVSHGFVTLPDSAGHPAYESSAGGMPRQR